RRALVTHLQVARDEVTQEAAVADEFAERAQHRVPLPKDARQGKRDITAPSSTTRSEARLARPPFFLFEERPMPRYSAVTVPSGDAIRAAADGRLDVPDHPIIPFIEGDGTGPDIWRASRSVFDAAVAKAYGGKRKIAWMEVYAGEKAFNRFKDWLPEETVTAFKEFVVGIKGPLTTPVGGGIRSLNVTLRQVLDLYVCLRPVRYFAGV